MSDVTFDEEPQYTRRNQPEAKQSNYGSIIGLMYKLGIAKTKNDANIVMGGIVAVCVVVSATMFLFVQPHEDPAQAAAFQQDIAHFQTTQHVSSSQ